MIKNATGYPIKKSNDYNYISKENLFSGWMFMAIVDLEKRFYLIYLNENL